jgi:hypothetical protein
MMHRPNRTQPSRVRIAEVALELTRLRWRLHENSGLTLEEWLTGVLRHTADFQNSHRLGVEPASEEPE